MALISLVAVVNSMCSVKYVAIIRWFITEYVQIFYESKYFEFYRFSIILFS